MTPGRCSLSSSGQEPSLTSCLTPGYRFKISEGSTQLTGRHPEPPGTNVDFAQRRYRQEPARAKPLDKEPVETGVPEEVTEHDIDRRAIRQPIIEINCIEPASITDPTPLGQAPGEADRNARDVQPPAGQPPARQPDSASPTAAAKFHGETDSRKHVLVGSEDRRHSLNVNRRHPNLGVAIIPVDPVLLHSKRR